MSVIELKEQLLSRIQYEEDEAILQECLYILESDKGDVYELPAELSEGLVQIEAEMDRGEYLTHEEVMANAWQLLAEQRKRLDAERSKMVEKGNSGVQGNA